MKHQTCLQNYAADNCDILKFTSTCSSCILWIKLIHRDLVGKVTFGRYLRRRRKKNLMYKFSGSHMAIHILG
jgi:hypothetical protein